MTDLLRGWGILPTAVTGHSSGEIAAAYAAGILPLESCIAISYYRGMATVEFKKKFPKLRGAMLAVGASKDKIAPLITQLESKAARIACFNSPTSLTLSGDEAAIDELQVLIEKQGIFNRKVQVEMAYHSHHMELVADYYRKSLRTLDVPKSTSVEFYSSLFGYLVDGSKLGPSYWVDNLTQSVQFSEALSSMCQPNNDYKCGINVLVEIGPHSALAGPIKQILKACGTHAMKVPYASALIRQKDAVETMMDLASTLFMKGANLDMGTINFPASSKPPTLLTDMPRYPWNHKTKYWHEPRVMQKHKGRLNPRHDLLGTIATYSNDLEPTWRNILRLDDLPWLRQHKIQSLNLFPISGFVAMAVQAASQRANTRHVPYDTFELREIFVSTPLRMTDEDLEVTLQLRPFQEGRLVSSEIWDEFHIHSWHAQAGWKEHCKGLISARHQSPDDADGYYLSQISESIFQATVPENLTSGLSVVDKTKIFDELLDLGVSYGPSFQGLNECKANDTCSLANLVAVDTREEMPYGYQTSTIIQPAFLEQLVQMYWPILGVGSKPINTIYLPSSIGSMTVSSHTMELMTIPDHSFQAVCRASSLSLHPKPVQMTMLASSTNKPKEPLIVIKDLTISPVLDRDITSREQEIREICYRLDWERIERDFDSPDSINHGNGCLDHINGHTHDSETEQSNGSSNDTAAKPEVVIVHRDNLTQNALASRLADDLVCFTGTRPEVCEFTKMQAAGKICIFLPEITTETSLLSSLSNSQFTVLQELINAVHGIMWVVRGAYKNSCNPNANMITGLSRSIRSETMLKFATLDLDPEIQSSEELTIKTIVNVFRTVFGPGAGQDCNLEFAERKGKIFTPRIVNDVGMNEYIHKRTTPNILESAPFGQGGRPLRLAMGTPGVLETLHYVDQSMEEPLAADAIEIEVKAIGMNERDLMVVMGRVDHLDPGSECSGIVTQVGSNITNITVGDHVSGVVVLRGAYSTYVRIEAANFMRINKDMSLKDAASIPVAYCTAKYGLMDLGRLEEGEKVLICGAASATGQAAIELARLVRAEISATVTNTEGKQLLMELHGMRADQIILVPGTSTGAPILGAHRKGMFDLVLNCVSTDADTFRDIWGCVSKFGRFVEAAGQDKTARLEISHCDNNKSFMSVDLMSLAIERPRKIWTLLSDISALLETSKIKPISTTVFPISKVENAFRILQRGNVNGKLIIVPEPGDIVRVRILLSIYFTCWIL